jgi:hypothetical protein
MDQEYFACFFDFLSFPGKEYVPFTAPIVHIPVANLFGDPVADRVRADLMNIGNLDLADPITSVGSIFDYVAIPDLDLRTTAGVVYGFQDEPFATLLRKCNDRL